MSGEVAGAECPAEDVIADFVESRLGPQRRANIEKHIDGCDKCRSLIAALARSATVESDPVPLRPAGGTGSPVPSSASPPSIASVLESPSRVATQVGPYTILERLGAGGMGEVFLAFDPRLERRVALKLLHPRLQLGKGRLSATQRLLREAQALAKLSHPNAVTVFDVGQHDDQVYLAMEYVAGGSLADWLRTPRHWRAVVQVFLEAGRGLAAVHAAGLLHRDFKPQNVLVGADGRVRVTDFGLAQPSDPTGEGDDAGERVDTVPSPKGTAAFAGTPAYMAPEQRTLGVSDRRSDQYSFFVSLFEGLYGERPFPAALPKEMRRPPTSTRRRPRALGKIPAWLKRALERGLAYESAQRFPSMDAALAELELGLKKRRRARVAAAAAVVAIAGAVWGGVALRNDPDKLCSGAAAELAPIWSDGHKKALEEAFTGTGLASARDAARRATGVLDAYAADWRAEHRAACEATRVRGELSEDILDRRMVCLDQRRQQLAALISVLRKPDGRIVDSAVRAAYALADLRACADLRTLTEAMTPPPGESARRAIDGVRASLARAKALEDAGLFSDALAEAKTALGAASALAHPPVVAEAECRAGSIQTRRGEAREAGEHFERCLLAAERGRDDRTRAWALVDSIYVVGYQLTDFDGAERLGREAGAVIDRLGDDLELRARLSSHLATVDFSRGDAEAALNGWERALGLYRQMHGESHPDVANTLGNVGIALNGLGRREESVARHFEAARMTEALLGPDHQALARSLVNASVVLQELNRAAEAEAAARRALRIVEAAEGKDSVHVAYPASSLGHALEAQGRHAEALALLERCATLAERQDTHHIVLRGCLTRIGVNRLALGQVREAQQVLGRALALAEGQKGDPVRTAEIRFALARALWEARQRQRALALAQEALAAFSAAGEAARARETEVLGWLALHEED